MRGESEMNRTGNHLLVQNFEHIIFAYVGERDAQFEETPSGRRKILEAPRLNHFAFYNNDRIPNEVKRQLSLTCFSAPHVHQKTKNSEGEVINEYEKGPFFAEHIVSFLIYNSVHKIIF